MKLDFDKTSASYFSEDQLNEYFKTQKAKQAAKAKRQKLMSYR